MVVAKGLEIQPLLHVLSPEGYLYLREEPPFCPFGRAPLQNVCPAYLFIIGLLKGTTFFCNLHRGMAGGCQGWKRCAKQGVGDGIGDGSKCSEHTSDGEAMVVPWPSRLLSVSYSLSDLDPLSHEGTGLISPCFGSTLSLCMPGAAARY